MNEDPINQIAHDAKVVTMPWFPDINFLRLAYDRNRSYFHGLPHILRVWTIAMTLAQNYIEEIDPDVLSAAALFHDIGRIHDLKDDNHGYRSAEWIDEFFPVIDHKFSPDQMEMIKSLARLHCLDDNYFSTLELKILKDADAIDRFRLPGKKVNTDLLRLDESHALVETGRQYNKIWSVEKKAHTDTLLVWVNSTTALSEIPELIKSTIYEVTGDEKASLKRLFDTIESDLHTLMNKCKILEKSVRRGKHLRDILHDISDLVSKISKDTDSDPYIQSVSLYASGRIVSRAYRLLLVDHSLDQAIRKSILQTYKKATRFIVKKDQLKDSAVLYDFLKYHKTKNLLKNAFVDFLAFNEEEKYTSITLLFDESRLKKSKYSPHLSLRERAFDRILNNLSTEEYSDTPWLWILMVEKWITESSYNLENELPQKSLETLSYTAHFILYLLNNSDQDINQINALLRAYLRIEKINNKYDLNINTNKILNLWQGNKIAPQVASIYMNSGIPHSINIFYLYDGYIRDVSQHIKLVEHICIHFGLRKQNIDNIVGKYLLPISLTREFDYNINSNILRFLSSSKLIELIQFFRSQNQSTSQSRTNRSILEYYDSISGENTQKLVDKSKFKGKVSTKTGYEVVTNITNLQLLHRISENDGQLLSAMWNILKVPDRGSLKLTLFSKYSQRTLPRDIIQRDMLIRRPNIAIDQPFYGTLQNVNDLCDFKNIFSQIPTPTEIMKKTAYGNVVLVFKDEIKERTVFTLFDSALEHRKLPVTYEDAKYLYEKTRSLAVIKSVKRNPLTLLTWYVEAQILGGVTLNDVKEVIISKSDSKKHAKLIAGIQVKYPEMVFRMV